MIVYLNVPTRQSSQKRWPQTVWTGFLIATRQIEQVWPGDSLSTNTKSYPPYRGSVIFNTLWIFSTGDSCCTCSSDGGNIDSIIEAKAEEQLFKVPAGGVRHDPPRFMGRIVAVLKNITEEGDLDDFEDLVMLAIGFIRQFQWVYRDSETIEGRSCRFFFLRKILCIVLFICICLSQI